jgi:hypothetical protein
MKFAGDNFLRYSGEATNMQKLQMFAWQSSQRGHNVHAQANPTAGELLHREFQEKKEVLKDSSKVSILAKYGGEEHLERLPKELLSGQTENCEWIRVRDRRTGRPADRLFRGSEADCRRCRILANGRGGQRTGTSKGPIKV